jgi:YidC/Oxa1 family membrane protein insertase
MDQARLFIAIVLSFAVFLIWELFFVERKEVQAPPKGAIQSPGVEQDMSDSTATELQREIPSTFEQTISAMDETQDLSKKPRTITVNTPRYTVKVSEAGGVFTSFVLSDYRERVESDSPLKEMIPEGLVHGSLRSGFAGTPVPEDAVFITPFENDFLDVVGKTESLSFVWVSADGIIVEKQYAFSPETYEIGLTVIVKNGSTRRFNDDLVLSLVGKAPESSSTYGFQGPSALIGGKLEQIKVKKIKDQSLYTGELGWIAIEDRYFISSIIPDKAGGSMHLSVLNESLLESRFIQPLNGIDSGAQKAFSFGLFLGPKSLKILGSLNNGLDKSINFGWFDIIAKPCLWFMNFIYGFIPNYGVAIIILTIFTKILLWPLGSKSYKSMNEMKKIQPLMAELREKYRDDKKKMNEELMKLYRVYKINPMGGCLPMVVQIPVFIALYRMLYEAIELRHEPFVFWINDLSAPDRLFRFDFSIPFMQPPYGIPILTLIMGATMLLQQKMSPPPGDPAQAKMMMFMPIIFTFIFINFSSGLVLYWLVNNILSIAQQYYIAKKTA